MMSIGQFQPHAAFALSLIALVSGLLLLNKAASAGFVYKKLGKAAGALVAVAALLSSLCVLYLTIQRTCDKSAGMKNWQHPPMGEMLMMHEMPMHDSEAK